MSQRKSLPALALALLAALGIAACGGSRHTRPASTPTVKLVTPGATHPTVPRAAAVAEVQGTPIPKTLYRHWLAIDAARGGSSSGARHKALRFVITASWILGGARERHITVTSGEVRKRLANLEKKQFPKLEQLQSYLSSSRQTAADLEARVKLELLQGRIAEEATAKLTTAAAREAALARLQSDFDAHWTALTSCAPRYVVKGCKQYSSAASQAGAVSN